MSGEPSWKLVAHAPRLEVEAALIAHEDASDWDADIVIAGSEMAEDRPDDWRLEAWLPRRPTRSDRRALNGLFAQPPEWSEDRLPDTDWVTDSQQYLEPVRAGAFHIRTPHLPPCDEPAVHNFTIPASQAFGTGQHATTAGCLAMTSAQTRSISLAVASARGHSASAAKASKPVPVPISAQLRTTIPLAFIAVSIARQPAVVACWPVPKAWLAGMVKL